MKRDVGKLMELFKGKHGLVGVKIKDSTPLEIYGEQGGYFAMDDGNMGQTHDNSVIDFNIPPGQKGWSYDNKEGQPGLWCKWCLEFNSETEKYELVWSGEEKFYYYTEWLEYLIKHFFAPWKLKLNGEITWQGEESSDMGKIIVVDNVVTTKTGVVSYE